MKPDIVDTFVALARETLPDAPQAALQRLESEIRERHGGRRVSIGASRPAALPTLDEINAKLRRCMPVVDIAKDFGVHRSTIYRLLANSSKVARKARAATKRRA